ncbi:hypothetical protein [Plastoroseomonas arctica]|uniref:Uncharacterized protein n=1 Tax=Plastoroseomonas arctica TaxID=1509237 RepID=A0AAF1KUV7_9PROT|nr:hypothetical protein [Plastoroseomonas arctica]MBR0657192.1 hypothetical protein [Plastoroseomonas arctica]
MRIGYALPDGRLLLLASEEIGADEGMTLSLHAADGARVAGVTRRLWLGGGFVEDPMPDGEWALRFEFPKGVAWRADVRRLGRWLTALGVPPLTLRRM